MLKVVLEVEEVLEEALDLGDVLADADPAAELRFR